MQPKPNDGIVDQQLQYTKYIIIVVDIDALIRNWTLIGIKYAYDYKTRANPVPLFTKRTDVLPQDLAKCRTRGFRV